MPACKQQKNSSKYKSLACSDWIDRREETIIEWHLGKERSIDSCLSLINEFDISFLNYIIHLFDVYNNYHLPQRIRKKAIHLFTFTNCPAWISKTSYPSWTQIRLIISQYGAG